MDINQTILKKYFSGDCSAEEEAAAIEYLSQPDDNLQLLHQLMKEEEQRVTAREMPPVLLKSLVYSIRKQAYPEFLKPAKVVRGRSWYAIAAAAALLPFIAWLFFLYSNDVLKKPATGIAVTRWDTISNSTSSPRKARLPDGSQVWLNARSSFSYSPASYGKNQRVVSLQGAAFFDVVSDSLHPFIVQHGPIVTRVLGTAFNIEAYAGESDIRISLVRGKVAINAAGDNSFHQPLHVLYPGERLVYEHDNGKMGIRHFLYTDEEIWTKGWLVFDDITLRTALKRMENIYDMQISIPANLSLENKKVTAVFKGGTPKEILQNMLFAHGLSFRETDHVFYVRKSRSHN